MNDQHYNFWQKQFANFPTIIVANGEIPSSELSLSILNDKRRIVCCDGALQKLLSVNIVPDVVVGDGDSMDAQLVKSQTNIENPQTDFGSLYCRDAMHCNLKLVLSNVSCNMGSEGADDIKAGFRITASNLNYSSEGMLTETGAIVMKADKAVLKGDSANVSGFTFDSRDISLQLEDSVGTITKAQIAKVLLGLEGALKLDLSNVNTALNIDVEVMKQTLGQDVLLVVAG